MGWLALIGIIFGSAFGFAVPAVRRLFHLALWPISSSRALIYRCFAGFRIRRSRHFRSWSFRIPVLFLGYLCSSKSHSMVCLPRLYHISPLTCSTSRPTVIVGLFIQQAIAMFVLKSGAGFAIFKWIAILASDFLAQALPGAAFFFNQHVVDQHFFFVNTVSILQRTTRPSTVLNLCFDSSLRSSSSSHSYR